METWTKIFVYFLLTLSWFHQGFCSPEPDAREGTCTHSSQIIFLEPPADFSPQFEVSGGYCEYQGKVLFLLRNANKPQGSSWCIPGGRLELGETPLQALVREMKEETGIVLKEESAIYCRSVCVRFPSREFVLHLFRFPFKEAPPSLHLALEENIDYRWVRHEEVAQLPLIPGGKECFCIAFKDKLYPNDLLH